MCAVLVVTAAVALWLVPGRGSDRVDLVRTETGNPGAVGTSGVLGGVNEGNDRNPPPAPGGIIHELETITGANDGHQFVGRRVEMLVPVRQHINDVAFWAGMGDNRLLIVIARDNRDAAARQQGEPATKTLDTLRSDQQATVSGTIQRIPHAEAMASWGLTDADRSELMERRIYLRADTVTVAN